jgi:hypothetical protein
MTVYQILNFRLLLLPVPEYWKNLSLTDIDGEKWIPVSGYESFYMVSNYGRIKSLKRPSKKSCNSVRDKILKQMFRSKGVHYLKVSISPTGVKAKTKSVHILIATSFILNPNNKPQVNHKNCIKYHNWVGNLEWNTALENIRHSKENVNIKISRGEHHYAAKISNAQAVEIFHSTEKNVVLASMYGVDSHHICDIKKGRKWASVIRKNIKHN